MKLKKLKCKRCGHEWVPRIEQVMECSKCRSPRWNMEKGK